MAVVEYEAEGADEPELGPDGDAGPPDVPRVLGNVRLIAVSRCLPNTRKIVGRRPLPLS
jgi:hypothetical protein